MEKLTYLIFSKVNKKFHNTCQFGKPKLTIKSNPCDSNANGLSRKVHIPEKSFKHLLEYWEIISLFLWVMFHLSMDCTYKCDNFNLYVIGLNDVVKSIYHILPTSMMCYYSST